MQQPFGWLSDHWGRKPVLLLGLALFAFGGVVAAKADSMGMLIAGRALQGCGAIAGVAMALAADLTRPERRPVIMAIIGIGIGDIFTGCCSDATVPGSVYGFSLVGFDVFNV